MSSLPHGFFQSHPLHQKHIFFFGWPKYVYTSLTLRVKYDFRPTGHCIVSKSNSHFRENWLTTGKQTAGNTNNYGFTKLWDEVGEKTKLLVGSMGLFWYPGAGSGR